MPFDQIRGNKNDGKGIWQGTAMPISSIPFKRLHKSVANGLAPSVRGDIQCNAIDGIGMALQIKYLYSIPIVLSIKKYMNWKIINSLSSR